MRTKKNSEYYFTKDFAEDRSVGLTLYIDYERKKYDFMQSNEEGIMPKKYQNGIEANKAFMELGIEILKFVESELYLDK